MVLALVLISILVIFAASAWAFVRLPHLLTNEAAPTSADVIVILGGDASGRRVEHGVDLLEAGYSARVIMSGGPVYRETTSAFLMRQHAISLGVHPERVMTQDRSWTTEEDAEHTTLLLREIKASKAIIVTSSWHSARALKSFKRQAPDIEWVSCPIGPEWVGPWWENPAVARAITSEVLKSLWPD